MNDRNAGRKKVFSNEEIEVIKERHQRGATVTSLAMDYHVSRQTMSFYINSFQKESSDNRILAYAAWLRLNKDFAKKVDISRFNLRLDFMHMETLCTKILVSDSMKKVVIENTCDEVIYRAFGIVAFPNWNDYQLFLEDRCLPSSRQLIKKYLDANNIPGFDPISIIEHTEGRMAEDNHWIRIYRLKDEYDTKNTIKL